MSLYRAVGNEFNINEYNYILNKVFETETHTKQGYVLIIDKNAVTRGVTAFPLEAMIQ